MGVIYGMQVRGPAEMAAEDPFGGHGIRLLRLEEVSPEETAQALRELLGEVPRVTWETCIWADSRKLLPEQASGIAGRWEEKMRARRNGARAHDAAEGAR